MQTKRLLLNLLLRGILSTGIFVCTVLRAYGSFSGAQCTVRGNLFVNTPNVAFFNRDDVCTVDLNIDGNVILLWNSKHWAMIIIPHEYHGIYFFNYVWGSDFAYINNQSIHVEWGLVMRG